jgi:hypothetical protein
MAKWDAALYGESLVKQASLQQMWTPVKLNNNTNYDYGFGWFVGQMNGHRLIEHGGAWQGFTSYIGRYVDDKLTVIVLDNLAGGNAAKIGRHVAALYNPQLARTAIDDKEPQVTALAKSLLQKFTDGTAEQSLFTAQLRAELFPARAERISRLLKSLGTLNKMELVERTEKDGQRVYGYQLYFQNGTRLWKLTLTKENVVSETFLIDDY